MKNLPYIIPTILILLITGCVPDTVITTVDPNNEMIRYTGRINFEDNNAPEIYWPGSQIEIMFQGEELKAKLKDEKGENYFNIIIDEDSLRYIKLDKKERYYTLAKGLPEGKHSVKLIKRTEWDLGKTWFLSLEITDGKLLKLPETDRKIIEFFGNSITAGYAIEDLTGGDSPDSIYTNNYITYGAITARHFNADYYGTLKSGIGIMISWFPLIMPEMWDRLDPSDPDSKWDFSRVQPDLVVVNLFQNDSWLVNMPEEPTFEQRFGKEAPDESKIISSYVDFISKLRGVYPETPIICALGSMDATREGSPWPGYVTTAVERMDDPNLHTLFFPYIDKPGHPRVEDNRKMADQLIQYIEDNFGW
ncbi:MAG: SGNH/GDSL hydrolase family protein [Cyclobacteriaceae bacterium]